MASVDELWLVDFGDPSTGEPAHHRPALVVGPPGYFDERFPFVIVCPLTTAGRGLSLHIEIEPTPTTGITDVSYVQCELVRSVNRQRLVHRLGAIDTVTSRSVHAVLRTLLGHRATRRLERQITCSGMVELRPDPVTSPEVASAPCTSSTTNTS